jgi:hypothetical protein
MKPRAVDAIDFTVEMLKRFGHVIDVTEARRGARPHEDP